MKKIIFILLSISLILSCELISTCEKDDPLKNVQVGKMDNYSFDNDIAINHPNDAMYYLYTNITNKDESKDYWQLPEETYQLKTGDCEDFCILFMFLLKTKLNLDTNLIMIKNSRTGAVHTVVYPLYLGGENWYYETVNNFIFKNLSEVSPNWYSLYSIPYEETIWMTYFYHDNVGQYR
jgi:hypothetical protein